MKTLSYKEIESISIASLTESSFIVANTGLSEELKKELSKDISSDSFIELLKLRLNGVWRTFSNDPTELAGIDENGKPIYKTVWNGEDWAYIPFNFVLNSVKASGEIVGGSLTIQNYNPEIAQAFDNMPEAVPAKVYIISKNTGEAVFSDELKYITSVFNNGISLQAELTPADIMAEQLPSASYDKRHFK